ncbi:MAG: hypothetical protein J6J24_04385 [Clostridia bacterium]|nr:hypothetical protein [Clostridia bacterium]
MKHFLVATYPCLVKTINQQFELDLNDQIEIENEQFIFIYPLDCSTLPFCINFNTCKENRFFSFIKKNEKTYIILEKQSSFSVTHKEILKFNDKICTIEINNHKIAFETDKKKCEHFCFHSIQNYKVSKIKNFAYLQLENECFLFSMTTEKLTHILGSSFDLQNDKITFEKHFFDSQGRTKIQKLEIEEEGILMKEERMIYNKKTPSRREFVSFKFMESIRAKDFDFAHTLLCKKLQESVNKENLQTFFGNISFFVFLEENQFLCFSQNSKNFVSFAVEHNEIQDITLDSL